MKKIVQIFKRAEFHDDMSSKSALIQEVPTGFGAMHDVFERFLKLDLHVSMVLQEGYNMNLQPKCLSYLNFYLGSI